MQSNYQLVTLFQEILEIFKPHEVEIFQLGTISNEQAKILIIELVKEMASMIVSLKDQLEEYQENKYEKELQRLEGTIRNHIRVEQQQRLHIEALTQKQEEEEQQYILEITNLNEKIKSLENICSQISINKVQNLNQTNFIIEGTKKSPTAFDRLNQLVSSKQKLNTNPSASTVINSQQLLKIYSNPQQLMKKLKDQKNTQEQSIKLDTQQSDREQSIIKLRRCVEDNKSELFQSQRAESSSIEKYNRSKKAKTSSRQSQLLGNSFEAVSKTMQYYKKQQKSLATLRQSWKK